MTSSSLNGDRKTTARRGWHPSADTKAEIAEEAERLFRTKGYATTTVGDIARNLGMSPANVFKYFGGKAGLLDHLAAQHIERLDLRLDALDAVPSAAEHLRRMVSVLVECHFRKMEEWPTFMELVAFTLLTPPPSAEVFRKRLLARFEGIVAKGIASGEFVARNPGEAAECVFACLLSAVDPVHLHRELGDLSPAELTDKCLRITDFVIGALRMPIVK